MFSFQVLVRHRNEVVLDCKMTDLRDIWEETSFQLENFQCNPDCVAQEAKSLKTRTRPKFRLSFQMAESRRLGEFPGISKSSKNPLWRCNMFGLVLRFCNNNCLIAVSHTLDMFVGVILCNQGKVACNGSTKTFSNASSSTMLQEG